MRRRGSNGRAQQSRAATPRLRHKHSRLSFLHCVGAFKGSWFLLLILACQAAAIVRHRPATPTKEAFAQLQNEYQSFGVRQRNRNASFVPNWRRDLRCGAHWPALDGAPLSVCDPFSADAYCCSHWGWCGSGSDYCDQALLDPRNATSTGAGHEGASGSCSLPQHSVLQSAHSRGFLAQASSGGC